MRVSMVLAAALLAVHASAQLTQAELKGVHDTLFLANLSTKDLEFERKLFADPQRLPLINLALDKPLDAADALMDLHSKGQGTLAGVLSSALTDVFGQKRPLLAPLPNTTALPAPVPEPLRRPVITLVEAIAEANNTIREATKQLTAEERRSLIEALPQFALDSSLVKFDFVKQPKLPPAKVMALVKRVDLATIRLAGVRLASRIEAELPTIRSLARTTPLSGTLRFRAAGVMVELSGQGDDVHTSRDTNLCIDLGGRNTYKGRFGAGIDYASVLIDCGSGSRFEAPDASIGSGVLGVGLAYVLGGDCSFRGKSLCFGSGLAGVGALYKEGGNDRYHAAALAEGFGEFGIGLLLDSGGDDVYEGGAFVQGAARTHGLGWLVDQAGNDTYRACGLIPADPLFKDSHLSMSQGYARGYGDEDQPISGGIGLLTDLTGDDVYVGENECQGASMWYGLGSLYDASGNDVYSAYHFAQASASHQSAGYLFDLTGDDSYTVKVGNCHAFAHDHGVAFLLDREGNDVYAARDSRPGAATANSLALFIDAAGEDRYLGPPALGSSSHGGALGVFCDLGGSDHIAEGLAPGQARVDEGWAVAYDAGTVLGDVAGAPAGAEPPKVGSVPMPQEVILEGLFKTSSGSGQEAIEARNRLIGIGKPALDWFWSHHLATAPRGELRAVVVLIKTLGDSGRTQIGIHIASKVDAEAANALRIAVMVPPTDAGPAITEALKRPILTSLAVEAAAATKAKEATGELLGLAANDDRALALSALVALGEIGDESSLSTVQALLTSSELPIRRTAVKILGKYPAPATLAAQSLLNNPDERSQRTGIELLAVVGTPEAYRLVVPYLSGGTAGTKIQAMLALDGHFPMSSRSALNALRKDPNTLVAAIAASVDPGRE